MHKPITRESRLSMYRQREAQSGFEPCARGHKGRSSLNVVPFPKVGVQSAAEAPPRRTSPMERQSRQTSVEICQLTELKVSNGVMQGEQIRSLEDFLVGDTFTLKEDAKWSSSYCVDIENTKLALITAANETPKALSIVARLIFYSAGGRRHDAVLASKHENFLFITKNKLSQRQDYVLVHVAEPTQQDYEFAQQALSLG